MSAVEEYAEFKANVKPLDDPIQGAFEVYADAAIAELEYELETARMMMRSSTAQAYKERLEQAEAEHRYPHMCRDGHPEIGHSTDSERCPVCLLRDEMETP